MNLHKSLRDGSERYKKLYEDYVKGETRKTEYIYNMAKKGNIYSVPFEDAEIFAEAVDDLIDVLNGVYKDRWEFYFQENSYLASGKDGNCYFMYVAVHYPEIKITNEFMDEHLIRDMYVFLNMRFKETGNIYFQNTIKPTRATVSFEEYAMSYIHSHSPARGYDTDKIFLVEPYFCLGENTEMVRMLKRLESGSDNDYMELFFHTLNSYVEWESTEGVPHMTMHKLLPKKGLHDGDSTTMAYGYFWEEMQKIIARNPPPPKLNFVFQDGHYRLSADNLFKDYLKTLMKQNLSLCHHNLYILDGERKRRWFANVTQNFSDPIKKMELVKQKDIHFWFRGKRVDFNIIISDSNKDELELTHFEIKEEVLDYAKARIEENIFFKGIIKRNESKI